MKKTVLVLLLFGLMAFSVRKPVATDYRDAYVGNYAGKRTDRHLKETTNTIVDVVSSYTLSVQKSDADSTLSITTSEGTYSLKLKTLELISTYDGLRVYGKFYSADSILINFIPGHGPQAYYYKGKKQAP
jgi:hypothetical protein